jgi:NADPH-dependent 7-cyano-7-deazaguanine reductase QueF-like protein
MGLGTFPDASIASYLARSTSLWFASFGVLLWFVSRDVNRNSQLIQFLGWAMLAQGLFMIGIDLWEGMPTWWIAAEGPTCLALAIAILWLRPTATAER